VTPSCLLAQDWPSTLGAVPQHVGTKKGLTGHPPDQKRNISYKGQGTPWHARPHAQSEVQMHRGLAGAGGRALSQLHSCSRSITNHSQQQRNHLCLCSKHEPLSPETQARAAAAQTTQKSLCDSKADVGGRFAPPLLAACACCQAAESACVSLTSSGAELARVSCGWESAICVSPWFKSSSCCAVGSCCQLLHVLLSAG
jgi:hypothetical protein